MAGTSYTLHYWPVIPGRGEYVRLAFEAAGEPYTENNDQVIPITSSKSPTYPSHFACPVLQIDDPSASPRTAYISQTGAILMYLSRKLGLDGADEGQEAEIGAARLMQLTLTALDLVNEAHDTHHPVASAAYYEEQKEESARRAADFRANRLPKFFSTFAQSIEANPTHSGWLVGTTMTVADLAVFQTIDGLRFAFPKRIAVLEKEKTLAPLFALYDKVASDKRIAAYLKSDRRKEYGSGIFRHYPELDGEK